MAYEIIFKKRFTNKVVNLLGYLETEWGTKVSENFLKKMHKRLETLSKQPYIGGPSEKIKNVRGILITRHNKVFYKVSGNKIIILNLYDTRIDPKKNPYR